MPSRTVFNKFGYFISEVHKVAKKKELVEKCDVLVRKKAMLVAAISSGQSWQSSKFLHTNDGFDKQAIMNEVINAFREGWRHIREADIEEVINSKIDSRALSTWLYYIFDKDKRIEFKGMFDDLHQEFIDGLEPLEIKQD